MKRILMGMTFSLLLILPISPSQAIVNGEIVTPDQTISKSAVMVLWDSFITTGHGQCSGTLIDKNIIITAAHCVVDLDSGVEMKPSKLRVYFGNFDGQNWNKNLLYEVEKLKHNKNYDPNSQNTKHDIAILKLKKTAPESFSPVPFLTEPSLMVANAPVTIAGFGNTLFSGDSDEPNSRILRSFQTRILNPISPKNGMIEFHRIFDLIQTFDLQIPKTPGHPELDYGGGMAAGDSGGPAYMTLENKTYIIGIASGYKDPDGEIASYENIPTHSKWIKNVIKSL